MPGRISEPVGPVDGRKVPRFAGSGSFGRLPEIDRVPDYDVAVLGAPFDSGTSYRPGARFGPMAVRQASRHLRPGYHVELDCSPFSAIQVVDAGGCHDPCRSTNVSSIVALLRLQAWVSQRILGPGQEPDMAARAG